MNPWPDRLIRLTVVCLAASATLILPALAGIGPSLPLAGLLFGLAAGLLALRDQLAALPTVVGYDLGRYGQDLWLAAVLGALLVLFGPARSTVELLTVGGVVGLVGMANYFLRPVVVSLIGLVRWLGETV